MLSLLIITTSCSATSTSYYSFSGVFRPLLPSFHHSCGTCQHISILVLDHNNLLCLLPLCPTCLFFSQQTVSSFIPELLYTIDIFMCLSVSSNSSGESVKVPSYKVSPLGSSLLPFLFLPVAYRSAELLPEITQDIKKQNKRRKKKGKWTDIFSCSRH